MTTLLSDEIAIPARTMNQSSSTTCPEWFEASFLQACFLLGLSGCSFSLSAKSRLKFKRVEKEDPEGACPARKCCVVKHADFALDLQRKRLNETIVPQTYFDYLLGFRIHQPISS